LDGTRAAVRSLLLSMLRREDQLRLSADVQNRYQRQKDDFPWKIRVTEDVQKQVCREFGFRADIKEGLDLLRSAEALFPGDAEVKDSCHWLRHNICKPCPISVGDVVPNVTVYTSPAGMATQLHEIVGSCAQPTVIFAGSYT